MESWRFGRAAGSYCERDEAVRPRAAKPFGKPWPPSERADERCDPNDGDLRPPDFADALDGGRPGVSLECFRLGLLWSDHRFGAVLDTCNPEPAAETSLLETLSSPAGVVIPVPVPLLLVAAPSAK